MKANKKLTPHNVAPVKRKNAASLANGSAAIAPSWFLDPDIPTPFAGDGAE